MATQSEVSEVLAMLAVTYPRYQIGKDTARVYYQLLKDIPADEMKAAASICATTKTFFPSVHELRFAVADLRKRLSDIPDAYEAWEDILKAGNGRTAWIEETEEGAVIHHGEYQFKHPIVKVVAQRLGWPDGFPLDDNIMADRAHYLKAYESAMNKAVNESVELPEVREYLDSAREQRALDSGQQIKLLAERMHV